MNSLYSDRRQAYGWGMNNSRPSISPQHSGYELQSILNTTYDVGWICALHEELAAARAMFDVETGFISQQNSGDDNIYAIGKIHNLNVVIACLPAGVYGPTPASTVARNMKHTFPSIRVRLLVGIGGGIPDLEHGKDIRLGDVVVSLPSGEHGGVVQYTHGKLLNDSADSSPLFKRTGTLNKPPEFLLKALSMVRSQHESEDSKAEFYLNEALRRNKKLRDRYGFPSIEIDRLHASEPLPRLPNDTGPIYAEIPRPDRANKAPVIHYGTIASSGIVMKHAGVRDFLRDEYGAVCVEMEAAGLMDTFECLVIRGISDYADAFKNDGWHRYAAATAAAFAKEFLYYVSSQFTNQYQPSSNTSQTSLTTNPEPERRNISRSISSSSSIMTTGQNTAEIFDRANRCLKRRAVYKDLLNARGDFLEVLSRLKLSDNSAKLKELVVVYNKLTLTCLQLSHLNPELSERIAHVVDAMGHSELALENALASGHHPRITQMRFYVARVTARYIAMTDADVADIGRALIDLESTLAAVKIVDAANARAYDDRAEEDMKRLRDRINLSPGG